MRGGGIGGGGGGGVDSDIAKKREAVAGVGDADAAVVVPPEDGDGDADGGCAVEDAVAPPSFARSLSSLSSQSTSGSIKRRKVRARGRP